MGDFMQAGDLIALWMIGTRLQIEAGGGPDSVELCFAVDQMVELGRYFEVRNDVAQSGGGIISHADDVRRVTGPHTSPPRQHRNVNRARRALSADRPNSQVDFGKPESVSRHQVQGKLLSSDIPEREFDRFIAMTSTGP